MLDNRLLKFAIYNIIWSFLILILNFHQSLLSKFFGINYISQNFIALIGFLAILNFSILLISLIKIIFIELSEYLQYLSLILFIEKIIKEELSHAEKEKLKEFIIRNSNRLELCDNDVVKNLRKRGIIKNFKNSSINFIPDKLWEKIKKNQNEIIKK
jgi:hypothetical protein